MWASNMRSRGAADSLTTGTQLTPPTVGRRNSSRRRCAEQPAARAPARAASNRAAPAPGVRAASGGQMVKAIRIHETGGPDVLRWEDVEVGAPGPGEVRVRQTAVAVNYIDTYQRSGLYPMKLPAVIGNEAAGVVEAVGQGVTSLKTGDRIAYPGLLGAYAEARLLPADKVVRSEEHTSELQSLMRNSYAVFCLKKKNEYNSN